MRWRYNKYHSKKTIAYGIEFDSKKEAMRYRELKFLEASGKIENLKTQVKFVLLPAQREPDTVGPKGGKIRGKVLEREVSYIADFVYVEDGRMVVEDTKGVRTPEYVIKRKLMLYMTGIRIKEV
jgi:hypothetical protein